MAFPSKVFLTNDNSQKRYPLILSGAADGNLAADDSYVFAAPFAGDIVDLPILSAGTNGVDSVDPLFTELDVLINGTSIFTTRPRLDKTAGAGQKDTATTGTGITQGVLKAAASLVFAKGDLIKVTLDVTRTTPDTEFADVAFCVFLDADSDKDTDPTVAV